jgi:hypothetical protein
MYSAQNGQRLVLPVATPTIVANIVEFANRNRLPSTFGMKDFVEVGGLMSYGPDTLETIRQSVTYVDKILKGAKPADLPVEQPTQIRVGDQPQDGRSTRLDHTADDFAPGGSRDPVAVLERVWVSTSCPRR